MSYTVCVTCNGRKEVNGIGHMKIKCSVCSGSGYVSHDDDIGETPIIAALHVKRGRKPKSIED